MLRGLALTVVLGISVCAAGQSLKVEKYKLPNGMTVILHEDHSQPLVAVNIWYKVGSKDEAPRRSGFAHLFEHLMFMGTNRVKNGEFDTIMEEHGGNNNASTTEDRTNYFESGPSNLLPILLWLEADRLEALDDAMDQKKLDLQREVVKNERRQGVDNAPYGRAYEAIPGLMFPPGHPYHTSVIGSMSDLDNGTVANVKGFFNTFYVPNNASLVIAGDFNSQEVKPLIAKLFGTLPKGKDISRKRVPPLAFRGVKRQTMNDNVQASKVIMVWHSPAAYKPGDVEMRLAAALLSGGFTSRLYQSVVVEKALASDVSAIQNPLLLGSNFIIDATARENVPIARLESAIDQVISKFVKDGPTQAELQRQLAQVDYFAFSSLQSLQNKADRLNEFEFYFGNPNSFANERQMFHAVTPRAIRTTASKVLDLKKRLILRVVPAKQAEENRSQVLRVHRKIEPSMPPLQNPRDQKPPIGEMQAFNFPLPTSFTLANGIKVFYWRKSDLPLITLAARFNRGAAADPSSKAGRMNLMADMLDESAGNRNASQFSDAVDNLGAQLGTGADQRGVTVQLSCLSAKFTPALDLMADAVIRPRMNAEDWKRVKDLQLEALAMENDDPETVASKVANREFFGPNHPYSRPVSGSTPTVRALTLADVRQAYRSISPSQATIFACGSLSSAQLKTELDKRFGKWLKAPTPEPAPTFSEVSSNAQRVVIVDRPDAVQTVIQVMMPTVPYTSPDRYGLSALGVAFGGTFTSRLNRNLREDKGYTYGAGLAYSFSRPVSFTYASTSVRADVTGASVKEILAEIKNATAGNFTAEEASKARNTIRVDFVNAFGTRQGIVGTAIAFRENGIPFDQLGAELQKFYSVTPDDLNKLASEALPLNRALIVLVGDKDAILKQIAGLDLATPQVVSPGQ